MKPIDFDKITRSDDLINADYSDLDYVVEGLPLGLVGSLIAAGASGKSFFAMQQAFGIAIGRDGQKRGQVIYFAAEDPEEEFGKRIQSISKAWGLNEEDKVYARKNLWMISLLAKEPNLTAKKNETDDVYEFIEIIKPLCRKIASEGDDPLRLIYFDTLRRFHFLDENEGGAMSMVLSVMEQICHELHCSCIFLHHINKSSALNNNSDMQQAARGSSVLSDNIRFQQFLAPMSKDEAENFARPKTPKMAIGEDGRRFFVRFGVSKQNYGSPIPERWYERDENGVLMPADIIKIEGK
ncbi:helicase RepA family protein [Solidesulfovibrio magneticus]|uniref:RecA-family ATPase n=1 Tax=Solidesulfovibrio magneticus (strain ATCC 700980 / DSM 13731 / RS-1) TaxID=573370 RepID=C4XNI6_SOLM1|nr:helicase RepA family protein [Solidesulfovibrio magneticus]BAH74961.1 hypothetical protein DMR_14700 [Solidesulfovibrio magneticus RS-1]